MCSISCRTCEGTGRIENTCRDCNGSGEGRYDGSRCSSCSGRGVDPNDVCDDCDGVGSVDCEVVIDRLESEIVELRLKLNKMHVDQHKKNLGIL